MAGAIEGVGGVVRSLEAATRVRGENVRADRREGVEESTPRIQDSATSRRIKDGVNAPGQMGPLSPAEHRIVEQVQKSLEGEESGAAGVRNPPSGGTPKRNGDPHGSLIDILA